jgi:hypothetical protein
VCERIQLPGGGTAMICASGTHSAHCRCGRSAVALCDWKVPGNHSGTCDAPLCADHAKAVARNKHLCPEHDRAWSAWQNRHPAPQMNLFSEAS